MLALGSGETPIEYLFSISAQCARLSRHAQKWAYVSRLLVLPMSVFTPRPKV